MNAEWPQHGLDYVTQCPICQGEQAALLYADSRDVVFRVAAGNWRMYKCAGCASLFLNPRPSRQMIGEAYERYFTHDASDPTPVRRIGTIRSFLHDVMNGYAESRYGARLGHASPWGRWLVLLMAPLRFAVDAQWRRLPNLKLSSGRVLDIGCGNGGFLARAEAAGWEAVGIDLDPQAVATCRQRGLSVMQGDLSSLASLKAGSFDHITSSHVIEHLHDPGQLLTEAYRLLRPGGTLWLETPNALSLGHRRFGRFWLGLDVPRHLVVFSPKSLRQMVRCAGFFDLREHHHGLAVFGFFSSSEALRRNAGAGASAYSNKMVFLFAFFAELKGLISSNSREFITLTARKPR
jgi:2-polyprenyl-3-methyl-5-hydroxy-6-metoxy-1,4-benzoquinol methylase